MRSLGRGLLSEVGMMLGRYVLSPPPKRLFMPPHLKNNAPQLHSPLHSPLPSPLPPTRTPLTLPHQTRPPPRELTHRTISWNPSCLAR